MSTLLANPVEMIAHGAPRTIHNDNELEEYTKTLFSLTAKEDPSTDEIEAINLLTLLIEHYEKEHYSIPAADPVSVVRHLMEHQRLTQRDLIPQFGNESAVSMFMNGHREITIDQVKALSARFTLPADVFMQRISAQRKKKVAIAARSR